MVIEIKLFKLYLSSFHCRQVSEEIDVVQTLLTREQIPFEQWEEVQINRLDEHIIEPYITQVEGETGQVDQVGVIQELADHKI